MAYCDNPSCWQLAECEEHSTSSKLKRSSAVLDMELKVASPLVSALGEAAAQLLSQLRKSPLVDLSVTRNKKLQRMSIFDAVDPELQADVLRKAEACVASGDAFGKRLSRAIGAMVGMAVADGLGHNFEFMDVRDYGFQRTKNGPFFEYPCESCPGGKVHNPLNQFNLQPGQWTDDCSMGLCMADSLLARGGYDGTSIRIWFWNWWENGLDNAFKRDFNRQSTFGGSLSVGLGGNISKSISDVRSDPENVTPRFEVVGEDAGNGSLMRLAPIPLRFHSDVKLAREMAFESSLTTHPGFLAAEACSFYAHAIVRALYREDETESIVAFLDRVSAEYLALPGEEHEGKRVIARLLRSEEPDGTERCWNWKDVKNGLKIEATLRARGKKYNGYPVSAGYFGAFSIDGLAMALHCLYTTTSFNMAIAKVINYCGDADTTGAICAQLAGAFYGYSAIDPTWASWLRPWDNREIELRAIALFLEGQGKSKPKA